MPDSVSREDWAAFAQTFEFDWWSTGDGKGPSTPEYIRRGRDGLRGVSREILERFGFAHDQFAGQTVLDVGCGPTGRLSWLDAGTFVAIEPLGDKYASLPWAMLDQYSKLYSVPAEDRIPELVGKVDFLFSLNAIDHGFDLSAILANLHSYLKPGGSGFLSVDCDKTMFDPSHPLIVSHDQFRTALETHGFTVTKEDHGRCCPFEGKWLDAWGGGMAWHYWVKA